MATAVAIAREKVATLRALGFNTISVLVSMLGESLVLGGIGGLIGGLGAPWRFNGYQTSTMNFQTFSRGGICIPCAPLLLAMGLIYALVMGLIGDCSRLIRAIRLPIPMALREL